MNLITGGTGFVGGHLGEYFFKEGEISAAIFRKGSLVQILDQCGIQNYEGDLLDRESLHEPLHGVDVVYNLASAMPGDGDTKGYLVNTDGVRNLIGEAKDHGVKTLVHLSTLDVYGLSRPRTVDETTKAEPSDPYQRSKFEAEKILLDFAAQNPEIKIRIIRAARAVGARDATLTLPLLAMEEEGKAVIPSKRGTLMSMTHPKDIAQALYKAATSDSRRQVTMVKSFDADIFGFAEMLASACGLTSTIKERGLLSGRTLFPEYTTMQITGAILLKEQSSWKDIGYAPAYSLKQVCSEVKDWYAKEPWVTKELPR